MHRLRTLPAEGTQSIHCFFWGTRLNMAVDKHQAAQTYQEQREKNKYCTEQHG